MENENLFKEIQAYPELNSPLNFFPIINHDLEKYNSKYRNAEKSKIFSSVLFGFDKIQTIQVFYQENWFGKIISNQMVKI